MPVQQDTSVAAAALPLPEAQGYSRTDFVYAGGCVFLCALTLYHLSETLPDVLRGWLGIAFLLIGAPLIHWSAPRAAPAPRPVAARAGEMEDRYRALFERSRDPIYLLDFTGRFIDANQAALDLLGYRREEIPNVGLSQLLPADELPKALRALAQAAATGAASEEFRLRRKDGGEVIVDINSSVVYAGGKPHSVQGIARDVTGQRRAAEALRESEERYRAMVEQSISGFYIIEQDAFSYANRRMAQILGFDSSAELIGQRVTDLVAERDRARIAEDIRRRLAGEADSIHHTFTGLRKDGSEVEIGAHGARITAAGRPAIIGLMQDISDARRAQREAQHYVAQLEQAVQSTIRTVATMGELRDPYTHGHERRVGEIAAAIARELGMRPGEVEGVRIAGYLHDVGKIAVPAEILSKPSRLTAPEFALVKDHALHSHEILKPVPFPWPVASAAAQHHERWDGSGYPYGLKGAAIILEARILGVADTVEAMASHRPYRPGLGLDRALREIESNRGRLYDPRVADACLRLFREKGFSLPD